MAESVFRGPGEGGTLVNPVGGHVVFKVRGEQSDGAFTALETIVAPGEGPPLHTHANEDETLFVIEGEVRFRIGDEVHTGHAGAFVFVARHTPHAFQNAGDTTARLLVSFSPAGMERFFDAFAALEQRDAAAFVRLGAEVGMTVVGPPLAQTAPA